MFKTLRAWRIRRKLRGGERHAEGSPALDTPEKSNPVVATRGLSTLKRVVLGASSGGAYRMANAFEKKVRVAERDERRRAERERATNDS